MMKKLPMKESAADVRITRRLGARPKQIAIASLGAVALLLLPAVASAQEAPVGDGVSGASPAVGAPGQGPGWGRGGGGRGMGGKGMHGPGWRAERMAKAVGLSEAQVKQVKAVMERQMADMGKLRLQAERLRAEMRVEWLKDSPSEGKLRTLHGQMSKVRAEKAKLRFEARLKINSLLTPEQRTKAKSLGLGMGPGGGFGRGKGMGPGFGKGGGPGKGWGHGRGRGRHGRWGGGFGGGGFGGGY